MEKTGNLIKDHPVEMSAVMVAAGLLIGALLGGTAGCSLFSRHMIFLHGEALQSCSQSPVVLFGSTVVGGMIGASCGLLTVVFVYHRGRLTVPFSLGGAVLAVAAFAAWVLSRSSVGPFENYIFTGAFIALGGLAFGSVAGVIADHFRKS